MKSQKYELEIYQLRNVLNRSHQMEMYQMRAIKGILLIGKSQGVLILAYRNFWTLDASVGSWTLDAGLWTLDPGLWTLEARL